jgi:hypothetical protein
LQHEFASAKALSLQQIVKLYFHTFTIISSSLTIKHTYNHEFNPRSTTFYLHGTFLLAAAAAAAAAAV